MPSPYIPALDGLRAVAVAMVVAFHANAPRSGAGYLGVDVFFVLSGYLITTILLRQIASTGTIDFRDFYVRRFFRLMPALLAMLIVYVAIAPWLWPGDDHLWHASLAALYVSDYSHAFWQTPTHLSHTWSLSVEEHFYLLWPPVLLVAVRRYPGTRLVSALTALCVLAFAWRWAWLNGGAGWMSVYYRFDTRASGLLTGALLAALLAREQCRAFLVSTKTWIYCLPILAFVFCNRPWLSTALLEHWLPLAELGSAAIVLAVVLRESWITDVLSARPLVWLGKLSYGIYLWHYPIVRYLRENGDWTSTVMIGAPLSVALAWISSRTVEAWGYRLRDRLSRRDVAPGSGYAQPTTLGVEAGR